jgi:hypothetical protein
VTITPVPGQQLRSGVDDDWEQPGIAMAGAVQYGDWKMLEGQQAHLATEKDMQGLKTPRSCRSLVSTLPFNQQALARWHQKIMLEKGC